VTNIEQFDYIIVGAGSAGCVLANRLSADPANKVCLVEAGGSDNSILVRNPLGIIQLIKSKTFNWLFNSLPEAGANKRNIFCPRGKGLGGSSSINAMIYIRGQRQDYDDWAAQGNKGWSYSDVLPYFKSMQHQQRSDDQFHGANGELWVSDSRSGMKLNSTFITACRQADLLENPDFNGASQEGVGLYQFTQKNGNRCSAAHAFLDPIKSRPNLTIKSHFKVAKVLFEGHQATGIEGYYEGSKQSIFANKEVILSAGAFQSPQLLMLSGIGCQSKLAPLGIKQVLHLSGVGENLQEHVDIINVMHITKPLSIALRPWFFIKLIPELFKLWFSKKGFFTSCVVEAGGFVRSDSEQTRPNIQIQFSPLAHDDHGRNLKFLLKYGISLHCSLLRPKSRGSVGLTSADFNDDPAINLNILNHPDDMKQMLAAVRLNRKIMHQDVFQSIGAQEVLPGEALLSDADLEQFVRNKANHVYHPVGTCKMGSDSMAVVDERLRVRGIKGLRVVDASIMPTIVSGNTNAPSMMIGVKAADMILHDNIA
jgi:choline dehydrogenase